MPETLSTFATASGILSRYQGYTFLQDQEPHHTPQVRSKEEKKKSKFIKTQNQNVDHNTQ